MNGKYFGEIGQNVVIGELSKYGIGIAVPLGDNLPFDLIAIVEGRLYKLQVKSSGQGVENESVVFEFRRNDFNNGETKLYSKQEIDVMIGVNLRNYKVYLFDDFENRKSISIRLTPSKNGQRKNMNMHEDFILNSSRIQEIFNFNPPNLDGWFSKNLLTKNKYNHVCRHCGISFTNSRQKAKNCGPKCSNLSQRHVQRPDKSVLQEHLCSLSWRSIGRKYGVSDNAVRKWARSYGLL